MCDGIRWKVGGKISFFLSNPAIQGVANFLISYFTTKVDIFLSEGQFCIFFFSKPVTDIDLIRFAS